MSLFQSVLREDYEGFIESFDDIMADKVAQALDVFYVTEGRKLLLGKVEEDEIEEGKRGEFGYNRKIRKAEKQREKGTTTTSKLKYAHKDHANREIEDRKKFAKESEIEEGRYQGKKNRYTTGANNRKETKAFKAARKEKDGPGKWAKADYYADKHNIRWNKASYAASNEKRARVASPSSKIRKKIEIIKMRNPKRLPESENLDEGGLLLKQNRRAKRSDKALQKGAVRGDSVETLKGRRAKTKYHNLDTVNRFRTKSGQEPLGKVSKYRDKIVALKAKNPKRLPEEELGEGRGKASVPSKENSGVNRKVRKSNKSRNFAKSDYKSGNQHTRELFRSLKTAHPKLFPGKYTDHSLF